MKAAYWIAIAFCAITAIAALAPASPGQEEYVMLSRVLSLALSLLLGTLAVGIRKRRSYGWWAGAVLLSLIAVGFLGNITNVIDEKDRAFVIWIVVSQLICAAVAISILVKWWIPKKVTFFKAKSNR